MSEITEKDVYGQEQDPERMPVGRPTKYDEKYNKQVYKLCLLGAIDKELADFLDIEESTLNNWKHAYPEFMESIKKGKVQADAKVAKSLFHRANGYSHPDIDIKVVDKEIVTTEIVKHYPPDTTAGIFWLKNRQPEKWRDRQEIKHDMPITTLKVEIVRPNPDDNDL